MMSFAENNFRNEYYKHPRVSFHPEQKPGQFSLINSITIKPFCSPLFAVSQPHSTHYHHKRAIAHTTAGGIEAPFSRAWLSGGERALKMLLSTSRLHYLMLSLGTFAL